MQIRLFFAIFFAFSLASCGKKESIESPACATNCKLKPESGSCKAYLPRYYFDQEEKKCKEFIWGGCEGVVPFETLEECNACGCE